jgi:hypothetical protein
MPLSTRTRFSLDCEDKSPGSSRCPLIDENHQPLAPVEKRARYDTVRLNSAPRCSAKSKRSGLQCKSPRVRGWVVCRMHGARGGAPCGRKNGQYRHGQRSLLTILIMRWIGDCVRLGLKIRRIEAQRRTEGDFTPVTVEVERSDWLALIRELGSYRNKI